MVCYLAMWFLPFEPGSMQNILYLGAVMTAYWVVFTVVLGPYSALLPEIATSSRGRIVLSSVMGLFGALGMILGGIAGEVISRYPDGATVMGIHVESGIQLVALFGGLAIALCVVPAINIRETPHTAAKEVQTGVWQGVRDAAKNPAFFPVVGIAFFFKLAGTMIIAVLPYLTTVVLERSPGVAGVVEAGMGEAWQSRLLAIVVIGAVLWMPFIHKVCERRSHKTMMALAASIYALGMIALPASALLPDPTWGVIAVMLLLTFPTSIALIMPPVLFADVIDYDETMSGLRREGIYTGAVALLTKWSEGLARVLVISLLALGSARDNAIGIWLVTPAAGACMLLGLWLFRHYPEQKMKAAIAAFQAEQTEPPSAP
jgi:GPH family glycoside/pentoside/hexuronide:cation symporter